MNPNSTESGRRPNGGGWFLVATLVVAVLVVLAARSLRPQAAPTAQPEPAPEISAPAPVVIAEPDIEPMVPLVTTPESEVGNPTTSDAASQTPPSTATPVPVLPPASFESLQRVAALWNVDLAAGAMTPERAAEWKANLGQLIQGGAGSVPALSEFLKSNQDQFFGAETTGWLGYPSARTAALDALAQIGGSDAIRALGEVLQTTAAPREIAALALTLETLAPGEYRSYAVEAARQALAMAGEKRLEEFDVAPLFEVFQKYGGSEVISDLERSAKQWNYYGTLALGNLPEGAGVPSLIRIAEVGPDGRSAPGRLQALQVLAQLAGSNADARAALIQQVQGDQIAARLWPYLSRPLAGDQAHVQDSVLNENLPVLAAASTGVSSIKYNNQNFFYAPSGGGLTADQANQQLVLVNELATVTSNPDALRVLEQTKLMLEQRLAKASGAASQPTQYP